MKYLHVDMDGLYLPDGRQLALIDREWILDELPHLGNPDDNSDANYLLASAAAANSGASGVTGSSAGRSTSGIGGAGSSHGVPSHTGAGTGHHSDPTGTGTGTSTGAGAAHHSTAASHNHSLLYNPDEFEGDLTLLSEIIDETQNKWSDFGLNQLLTPYARTTRSTFK